MQVNQPQEMSNQQAMMSDFINNMRSPRIDQGRSTATATSQAKIRLFEFRRFKGEVYTEFMNVLEKFEALKE